MLGVWWDISQQFLHKFHSGQQQVCQLGTILPGFDRSAAPATAQHEADAMRVISRGGQVPI
jgi:hypothetical protein